MQQRLVESKRVNYSYGPYNCIKGDQQWIRLSEGCCNGCPYCHEPLEYKIFDIPKIEKNKVGIIDMNLLCKSEALQILKNLPVNNGKKIEYEFVCGLDYRFLTKEIAEELRKHHFRKIRIAWDWWYSDQLKIRDALKLLYAVGYKSKEIMIFMICNYHGISYEEICKKLDVCKVWNVLVADCYYDNQVRIHERFIPIGWTTKDAYAFRDKVRKHNQLVNFGVDPELKHCDFKLLGEKR